eukprot:scaffold1954_cov268-Pinguiococcus_pyrenoidosus.AAC.71
MTRRQLCVRLDGILRNVMVQERGVLQVRLGASRCHSVLNGPSVGRQSRVSGRIHEHLLLYPALGRLRRLVSAQACGDDNADTLGSARVLRLRVRGEEHRGVVLRCLALRDRFVFHGVYRQLLRRVLAGTRTLRCLWASEVAPRNLLHPSRSNRSPTLGRTVWGRAALGMSLPNRDVFLQCWPFFEC